MPPLSGEAGDLGTRSDVVGSEQEGRALCSHRRLPLVGQAALRDTAIAAPPAAAIETCSHLATGISTTAAMVSDCAEPEHASVQC
jgi:hypothetical protein